MNGNELYALASESPAGQACIPMNFQHTAPRLIWQDGWIAEFWYYQEDDNGGIYAPRYYLALRLPGGAPLEMRTLEGEPACLGPAPELVAQSYWDMVNDYLENCACFIESPEAETLQVLEERWSAALPGPLRTWMQTYQLRGTGEPEPKPPESAAPSDLPGYWKARMEDALRGGDKAAYEEAKAQYAKALANGRH